MRDKTYNGRYIGQLEFEEQIPKKRQLNTPLVLCWCLLGAFWCLATAAVAKIWS